MKKLLFCGFVLALAASAQDRVNPPGRSICLLFDLGSMSAEEQPRAVSAAVQLIENKMTPADRVSVITFTSEAKLVQDFTGDRDTVIAALRKLVPVPAAHSDWKSRLQAIQDASAILEPLPGKKQLISFSSGPGNATPNRDQTQAAIDAAVRANVAVYVIDTRVN